MLFAKSKDTNARYTMSVPNGWYAVAYSHEISPSQVKPLSILNKEFVIFRSSKGKASVLDAYCPHQGTHLGYGGVVADDCIVCPFHRWHFSGEGKCTKISYASKIPALERNCLISLPTIENEGIIYSYFHHQNNKPDFQLPNFEEDYDNKIWSAPKFATFYLKTHIHELGENGFDIAHFKPVHHSEKNTITVKSDVTDKLMKFRLNVVYPGAGVALPFSKINVSADWTYYGMGLFSAIITIDKYPIVIRQNFAFTPQNDGQIIVRFSLRVNKDTLRGNAFAKWLQLKIIHFQNVRMVLKNFNEDRPIWENKIYRAAPVLCDGDGPILHYRRWAQQFYSENGPLAHVKSVSAETV